MNILQALKDSNLLGAALSDLSTWRTWLVVLKAAFGTKLTPKELETFHEIAGEREPPHKRVRELWAVAGRRGGKSRMAAALSVYLAMLAKRKPLAQGEEGYVLVLAPSRDQAKVVFRYCVGFIRAAKLLEAEIISETANEIRLNNNITIGCHANSFRTVRGRTLIACIFDEIAYFRDEGSAYPDIEIYRAVLPALATTNGMLIGISSPYRRTGLLHTKYRDHYGQDGDDVLIIQAETARLNPTINTDVIAAAHVDDPHAALAEWGAQFRGDLASLLDDELIDAAIDRTRPLELPPQPKTKYHAFVDASAGRHDHYTLCIGHLENERFIADVVRGIPAPCDPKRATAELAELVKQYEITEVIGDKFAGAWVSGEWLTNGLGYRQSDKTRSQLYLESVSMFARGGILMPEHTRMIRELRLLERRTHPSGQDHVDHPKVGSDDYSNVLCGCAWLARSAPALTFVRPIVWSRPTTNPSYQGNIDITGSFPG
jgi:hypothetical protein